MKHIRKYVWIDPYLLRLLDEQGIELSAFVNKSLAAFLDLPEDTTQKLLREKMEESAIRTRLSYMNEIRSRIQIAEQSQTKEDIEKAKQKELIDKLEKFGTLLLRTSCYPKIYQSLKNVDSEASCWDVALAEINNMNGNSYTFNEVWNTAIEWYRKCPVPQP
jgi:hypothetical protein